MTNEEKIQRIKEKVAAQKAAKAQRAASQKHDETSPAMSWADFSAMMEAELAAPQEPSQQAPQNKSGCGCSRKKDISSRTR